MPASGICRLLYPFSELLESSKNGFIKSASCVIYQEINPNFALTPIKHKFEHKPSYQEANVLEEILRKDCYVSGTPYAKSTILVLPDV